MSIEPSPEEVQITLQPDEALVLFELLSRWTTGKEAVRPAPEMFVSTAEPIALDCLLGRLEKILVAPFRSDYYLLLTGARDRLVSHYGADFPFGS
jgi:hypothetical protein